MNARDVVDKTLSGELRINMVHSETGEAKLVKSNLIVNSAYTQLTYLLSGALTNRQVSQIGFGVSPVSPAVTDLSLTGTVVWLPVVATYPTVYSVKFEAAWAASAQNATGLFEAGLLSADNTLIARTVFQEMKKSVGWKWSIEWTLSYSV